LIQSFSQKFIQSTKAGEDLGRSWGGAWEELEGSWGGAGKELGRSLGGAGGELGEQGYH